ncbi:hypothetical protein LOAG_00339 [Loa loa]|uniref:Uncharacterized protein n=1 Tax=Loa loa TaxID=7209 RepID=A0A1S0UC70_LOALO|nr:hypothetical protein LOAG_00339 [Loa loa]EFO28133.1 hypothetical protein LOAG_00339 [Loa loa]
MERTRVDEVSVYMEERGAGETHSLRLENNLSEEIDTARVTNYQSSTVPAIHFLAASKQKQKRCEWSRKERSRTVMEQNGIKEGWKRTDEFDLYGFDDLERNSYLAEHFRFSSSISLLVLFGAVVTN